MLESTGTPAFMEARTPPPSGARVAGLATATGEHWIPSEVLTGVLSSIWPGVDGRIARLLAQSGGGGRHFSRPVAELTVPLSYAEQAPRYVDIALRMAGDAARAALAQARCDPESIGALVVVSCTGVSLPGLDTRLVPHLGLRRDVVRMPFTQLGCAGGGVGLARGTDWVAGIPGRRALVVAVELPSLTFRPHDESFDNLLSALVFSDGAGAAVLERADEPAGPAPPGQRGAPMHLGRSLGVLIDGTRDLLGYELADDGFRVVLSRRLPGLIESSLGEIVGRFLGGGTSADRLDILAVHPGGTAVLDAVQRSLGAAAPPMAASWATFRALGNSSSAAIFFVLEEVMRTAPGPGSHGLSIAFGPGLSVELQELRWVA